MKSRLIYALMTAVLLAGAFLFRLADPVPVARLRLLVFDTYQQMKPREYDPKLPVRIIDVDEDSLRRIGQWPWPRSVTADLVTRLGELGAAVVAFDMIFPEPDRTSPREVVKYWPQDPALKDLIERAAALPGNDETLAKAIASVPTVLGFIGVDAQTGTKPGEISAVTSYAGDHPIEFVPGFEGTAASLPILQQHAKGSGALNWIPEHDQIARRMPLLVGIGEQVYPALSLEALRVAQHNASIIVKSTGASGEVSFGGLRGVVALKVGEIEVPTDRAGQIWVRFTPHDKRRFISAVKLLEGSVPQEEIKGRIILIGTSAAGLFDLKTTPLDGAVPGVELHAQALEQMILGNHLLRPDYATGMELVFLVLSGAALTWLIFRSGAFAGALLGALSVLSVFTASWLAYTRAGWLFDPVYPSIMLTALYIFGTVYVYRGTEKDRAAVRNAFSHYMSPAVVEELARDPSRLKLGGEMREVTLMFSDVRGFTTISEGLDAEALTRFLNRLLTPLTDTVLNHRGTIDKYMGDGIMAFWNAPLDDREHARNACRAALAMLADVARLNEAIASEATAAGRAHVPVRVGIGLNTAISCVGNLGSDQRFDYSVIGDGVNVASRLEGQTKTYGMPILVGGVTAAGAPDLALLEADYVTVMGKREAVHVFALLGDEARARSSEFGALRAAHEEMLTAYRDRRFVQAEALLEHASELGGMELQPLYRLYRGRIATYKTDPPPTGWDGVHSAQDK